MIVRILGEGQYDLAQADFDALNALDDKVEAAVGAGDDVSFRTALDALLAGVRAHGSAHDVDSLDVSDLILPPADASIDEVRQMLGDDGLIPG